MQPIPLMPSIQKQSIRGSFFSAFQEIYLWRFSRYPHVKHLLQLWKCHFAPFMKQKIINLKHLNARLDALYVSVSLRIIPCPSSKRHSANECPLYRIHLLLIVSCYCSREQFSWCLPRAFSTPRAFCFILRSDRFCSQPPVESTSANCSLPLMMILRVLSSATTCVWELMKRAVCVCALWSARVSVCSRGMRALTSC